MSLRSVLARRRDLRARRSEERAFRHALAGAPTVESAHELRVLGIPR